MSEREKRLLHRIGHSDGRRIGYMIWCQGCKNCHAYYVEEPGPSEGNPRWTFNGNMEKPTFTPSLLAYDKQPDGSRRTICHFNVTDGKIIFHGDCAHELAGNTLDLEPF